MELNEDDVEEVVEEQIYIYMLCEFHPKALIKYKKLKKEYIHTYIHSGVWSSERVLWCIYGGREESERDK